MPDTALKDLPFAAHAVEQPAPLPLLQGALAAWKDRIGARLTEIMPSADAACRMHPAQLAAALGQLCKAAAAAWCPIAHGLGSAMVSAGDN